MIKIRGAVGLPLLSTVFMVALGAAACGGASKSPVAPADLTSTNAPSNPAPPAAGTARISGRTLGALSSSVAVVGTAISSGVDSAGSFTLQGVPHGDVQLRFAGPGVNAMLTVPQVQPAQNITLVVTVNGGSASIDNDSRDGVDEAGESEIEGSIDALPPTTSAGTFSVSGHMVLTNASTQFKEGSNTRSFADLKLSERVQVKGSPSGSSVLAAVVEIEDEVAPEPNDNNNQDNHGQGGGSSSGGSSSGGSSHDGDQQQSASIRGTLTSMSGKTPSLTLIVGGTTVTTTGDTKIEGEGHGDHTLGSLQTGQTLQVEGARQADQSIIARNIEVKDDAENEDEVEIEGPIGGLSSTTCPSLTFGVNGFSIHTSGTTAFEDGACSTLKNGVKVDVKGTRNADGSVAATRVKAETK